ncbi:death-associated protein-like 1 [Pelobates fuscus]|uniref:death-associated protein-like 1 n=1 Tax=Pelobates fuscus TaxID=191477 RepID=UPI002FE4E379
MEVMYKATYPCDKLSRPPAVKAGGMRVTKKQVSESGAPEKHLKKPVVERPSSLVNMTNIQAMNLLTGALDKLGHEFPADAAYLPHQKPLPTVEKTVLPKKLYIIQQPRRF